MSAAREAAGLRRGAAAVGQNLLEKRSRMAELLPEENWWRGGFREEDTWEKKRETGRRKEEEAWGRLDLLLVR